MTTDEAIEFVYTDACVRALNAARKCDSEQSRKWHDLASHIEDRYPAQVQAIRDRLESETSGARKRESAVRGVPEWSPASGENQPEPAAVQDLTASTSAIRHEGQS